jgi:F-type H+-transporting ATPase subunit beta
VPVKDTVDGFAKIIEGEYDDIPESMFLNAGGIEDVVERFKNANK